MRSIVANFSTHTPKKMTFDFIIMYLGLVGFPVLLPSGFTVEQQKILVSFLSSIE